MKGTMTPSRKTLTSGSKTALVAAATWIVGSGIFALVVPPLQLWNLLLTLSIGATGAVGAAVIQQRPRLGAMMCVAASALTPIAAPALWFALFQSALSWPKGRATRLMWGAILAHTFLLVLFTIRWSGSTPFGATILIWIFSIVVAVGVSNLGWILAAHRRREDASRENEKEAIFEQRLAVFNALQSERERFSQDLHDHLGHRLSILNIYASSLKHSDRLSPSELTQLAEVLRKQIDSAAEDLKRAVGGRNSSRGMTELQIRELIADVAATGTPIKARVPRDFGRLSEAHGQILVQFCREVLTNALKHAPGNAIQFRVSKSDREIRAVSVNDLAHVDAQVPNAGTGLASLEARAAKLGGATIVSNSPPEFRVILHLPRRKAD